MTQQPDEEQVRAAAVLGPVYQGLTARYISNYSVRWQVFALGLTAQGFVVGAASQITGRPLAAILLCIVILFIGAATIVSSIRVGLYAEIDKRMLDHYERILLVGQFEELRLLHGSTYRERERSLPTLERPGMTGRAFERFFIVRIVRPISPSYWWVVLEFVISVAGASIPVLGIFGL